MLIRAECLYSWGANKNINVRVMDKGHVVVDLFE